MHALGMIETMGLIPSIEALDAMLKAANVETLEKTNVRGGLVTVIVAGDVSAVKAAVDAGAAAAQCVSQDSLLSSHVIPRPDSQTEVLFKHPETAPTDIKMPADGSEEDEAEKQGTYTRVELERFLQEQGIEDLMQVINHMPASQLKELAKEYEDGELQENKNARATKAELVDRLHDFYSKAGGEKEHE